MRSLLLFVVIFLAFFSAAGCSGKKEEKSGWHMPAHNMPTNAPANPVGLARAKKTGSPSSRRNLPFIPLLIGGGMLALWIARERAKRTPSTLDDFIIKWAGRIVLLGGTIIMLVLLIGTSIPFLGPALGWLAQKTGLGVWWWWGVVLLTTWAGRAWLDRHPPPTVFFYRWGPPLLGVGLLYIIF